jgi:hypothetical protein
MARTKSWRKAAGYSLFSVWEREVDRPNLPAGNKVIVWKSVRPKQWGAKFHPLGPLPAFRAQFGRTRSEAEENFLSRVERLLDEKKEED